QDFAKNTLVESILCEQESSLNRKNRSIFVAKSHALKTLTLSRCGSRLWRENVAKALIPLERV
ncbi:MAG: hypothetical protein WB870_12880, partial [Gallionellaceae bacterium]